MENVLSDDAAEIGRHRHSLMRFSASLKTALVCGWSLDIFAAMSCTVLPGESPKTSPIPFSCVSSLSLSKCKGRYRESTFTVCSCLAALITTVSLRAVVSCHLGRISFLVLLLPSLLLHKTHIAMSVVLLPLAQMCADSGLGFLSSCARLAFSVQLWLPCAVCPPLHYREVLPCAFSVVRCTEWRLVPGFGVL